MCYVLFSELSPSHLSHDQLPRSKSESAAGEDMDEDEDEDYGNYCYMFHNIIISCFCDEIKT